MRIDDIAAKYTAIKHMTVKDVADIWEACVALEEHVANADGVSNDKPRQAIEQLITVLLQLQSTERELMPLADTLRSVLDGAEARNQ